MKNDTRLKLQKELDKNISQESEVIYVLLQIRKILETDKKEKEYRKLKFFCDWALHSQIDYIDPVKEIAEGLAEPIGIESKFSKNAHDDILNMRSLFKELRKFFDDHSFETSIFKSKISQSNFRDILWHIYSETPLIVKKNNKNKDNYN